MKEHLPKVYSHRARWIVVALIVAAAFFTIWTMGFFGTPGTPAVEVAPGAPETAPGPAATGP